MKWVHIFIILPFFGIAQESAFFETTIFFEDAVGNRDSVIIGHDPDAQAHQINSQFGEVDISHIPFDSVFEVRGVHYNDFNSVDGPLTNFKKIIGYTIAYSQANDCYPIVEASVFIFNCKNLPIKVSWDRNVFSNSICRNRTVLASHLLPTVTEFWYLEPLALENSVCLSEFDFFEFDLFDIGQFGFYRIEEIEGSGLDTLYAILLGLSPQGSPISPCTAVVSTVDINEIDNRIIIYPNPTSSIINIDFKDFDHWTIMDEKSSLIKKGANNLVNIEELENGIYFISLFTNDNILLQTAKFVKLE